MSDTQPHVYVPGFSRELTAPEFSTILKFYTHPNAPKPQPPPQPSQPFVYVPGFSTELTTPEFSTLLKFYTHCWAPKRRAAPQPSQPFDYVPQYCTEYTHSEKSALEAFSSQPHAYISRYSASQQSALDSFSNQPHAYIPRSFASKQSTLDAFASRFSAALACNPQAPDLNSAAPTRYMETSTMVPDQTQPTATTPAEALNQDEIPGPGTLSGATQEPTMPAAVIMAPNEFIQSAAPSQIGPVDVEPQLPSQRPAEYPAVTPLQQNIPIPPMHDGAGGLDPTDTLSAPPSMPTPALAPPAAADDDDEDDDNNLLKAHRRVRAKRNILVGGPMKWIPEEVAYGLKEALRDLKAANRKSKKRLLSRKKPISTTAFVDFTKNFEGFMPGDWTTRPKAKRDWIDYHMQLVLDKACGREPVVKPKPAPPAGKEQSGPSASGGGDGAADSAEGGHDDVDDLIPADWAVGEDEVGSGYPDHWFTTADDSQAGEPEPDPQETSLAADDDSAAGAPASGLDSMMSKMSIGKSLPHTASGLSAPAAQVTVN